MSMQYCDVCDRVIDTDFNAEHFPHDVDSEGDFSGAGEDETWGGR